MKNIFIYSLLILFPFQGIAQQVLEQSTKWNTTKTIDRLSDNEELNHSTSFISSPSSVEWIQNGGSLKYSFTVVSTNGEWSDVSQPGKYVYHVKRVGLTGTITFERNSDGRISIELIMRESEEIKWSFYFEVETVTLN